MTGECQASPTEGVRCCECCGATLAFSRHRNVKLCLDCYDLGAKAREWRKVVRLTAQRIAALEQENERLWASIKLLTTGNREDFGATSEDDVLVALQTYACRVLEEAFITAIDTHLQLLEAEHAALVSYTAALKNPFRGHSQPELDELRRLQETLEVAIKAVEEGGDVECSVESRNP